MAPTKQPKTIERRWEVMINKLKLIHDVEVDIDRHDEISIKEELVKLQKILSEQDSIMNEATEHIPDDQFHHWIAKSNEFEKLYRQSSIKLKRAINQIVPNERNEAQSSSQKSNIKLPEIPLPTFNGNYNEWVNYKEKFNSLIAYNTSLNDVQKLHYLKASLKQEAAMFQSPNDTFDSLWSSLTKRYEIKRIIIEKHINDIFNLKPITRESACDLRHIINTVVKNLRVLKTLLIPLDVMSEIIVINFVCKTIDNETRKIFEMQLESDTLPKWDNLLKFLENRCYSLENIEKSKFEAKSSNSRPSVYVNKSIKSNLAIERNSNKKCEFCKRPTHFINQCSQFLDLPIKERRSSVKNLNICINCLSPKHKMENCPCRSCKKCEKYHHTLLHLDKTESNQINNSTVSQVVETATENDNNNLSATTLVVRSQQVLLSTVSVIVYDIYGTEIYCKALLDSGSQSNFITENIAQMLKLKKIKVNIPVYGINEKSSTVKSKINATIKSRINEYKVELEFLILPKISGDMPLKRMETISWKIPEYIQLADPYFNTPSRIDMLLGAEIFYDIWCKNQLSLNKNLPSLYETQFGWVVAGKISNDSESCAMITALNCTMSTDSGLTDQIKRFWELENCSSHQVMSVEEKQVEKHYNETHRRQPDGRYIVQLPTKQNLNCLGDSKQVATKRFLQLERKLIKNEELKVEYEKFITEYIDLGHMYETIDSKQQFPEVQYFMPHHAVLRPESTSTKLRVVFDASAKSDTGLSLNDVLKVGPTIQQELFEILVRFRKYKYAFTADISKMYRQVLIDENQQCLQQILWRNDPDQPIKSFTLRTVTYGTNCAPYLATRTLKQLAIDEAEKFPKVFNAMIDDFYVDDILSGADDINEAVELQSQLIQLALKGGFTLHKWGANSSELLNVISNETQHQIEISDQNTLKTLGLVWKPKEDQFQIYTNNLSTSDDNITKRSILSDIARLFDPLGITGPIILRAKSILQLLWQQNLNWDDRINEDEYNTWVEFRRQLMSLREIEVPRCIVTSNQCKSIQIHGFCDASQLGYGACIYIHCIDIEDNHTTRLLCSKSRVAPIKVITIPRLELCSAVLLSQLTSKVKKAINIEFDQTILWTDSTIVLCWIRSQPNKMKTFVSHRIAEIQDLTALNEWRHVSTKDNPADVLSRGLMPDDLKNCEKWWNGPQFLQNDELYWPNETGHLDKVNEVPEMKSTMAFTSTNENIFPFENFSSLIKLQRVMAYIYRIIKPNNKFRESIDVYAMEMAASLKNIIKIIQMNEFHAEITSLRNKKGIKSNSKLISLNIFLDDEGLIRVGGRISNSDQPYETKHQLVLPKNHYFTKLLIRHLHEVNGHAGQQSLLSIVRQKYWPIGAKDIIRGITRNCVKCFKIKPQPVTQLMGDLPNNRVTICHPFLNVGIDYAGPVQLRINRKTNTKAYIAIFVCLSTKAIHIELVSELSTKAYIAALTRFIARRGHCQNLYSDNGTNFIGAKTELAQMQKMLNKNKSEIVNHLTNQQINFHFIPPRAPHMGGLWEAAVKSTKYHLHRIVGKVNLNFEELTTVLTKIESILNSRPLFPESNDVNDLTAITPGHFIIGRPLTSIVEPDYKYVPLNKLKRWQQLQKLTQHFWQRWNSDYLTNLQQRSGSHMLKVIKPGMLVVVKDEQLPPMQWRLGRIEELHPGRDEIVRVVTLKTINGLIKRPVVKICILPIQNNES